MRVIQRPKDHFMAAVETMRDFPLDIVESTTSNPTKCDKNVETSTTHLVTTSAESHASLIPPNDVVAYWRRVLAGCDCVPFPALTLSLQKTSPDDTLEHQLLHTKRGSKGFNTSTIIRAAWALIVGRLTDSDDVVYGVTVSSRGSQFDAATRAVPLRIKLVKNKKIWKYLNELRQQENDMMQFEKLDLQSIANIGPEALQACKFQTLLNVRSQDVGRERVMPTKAEKPSKRYASGTYALSLDVQLHADHDTVVASFDSTAIKPWVMKKLLERLEFVMQQIRKAGSETCVSDIEMVTPLDLDQLWAWNGAVLAPVEKSISHTIENRAKAQPDATAVCAWDGQLTYSELNSFADQLSARLMNFGVGPEVFVPLSFEKSVWTIVAVLAVLKANGAFILLDPSVPESRLQDIVQQTKATLVLSSPLNSALAARLASNVIVVNAGLFIELTSSVGLNVQAPSATDPSSAAYAIFTSGSTGAPKGVITTHSNISSLCRQASRLGFNDGSRVYDFVSYSFGISIVSSLLTLTVGGCLCVPSDQDRKSNLAGSINSLRATVVWLTPSLAESLSPLNVPTLKMIGFGGEQVQLKNILPWWGKVDVCTGYGSSECTTLSTLNYKPATPADACQIGTGAGVVTWVVDPENHNELLPIGAVGELLIEGPQVSRGYLQNPIETAASFITDPLWLLNGLRNNPGRHARLYKTGDLVKYNEHGSLVYMGRKDVQVKIRGQRVELEEVEHHLQQCAAGIKQAIAEIIIPQGENASPALAAFLEFHNEATEAGEPRLDELTIIPNSAAMEDKLAEHLPNYMTPTVFFSLWEIPMTTTGKINRKQLREAGARFSAKQLAEARTAGRGPKRQPTSEAEACLQTVWSTVLNIEMEAIGLDDSFFHLGGDSISAMKVVGEARKHGFEISVVDIFRQRRLQQVASCAKQLIGEIFRSIPKSEDSGPVEQSFAQRRLWFMEQLHPGLSWYLIPCAFRLQGQLDLFTLAKAILTLENRHESLRTVFTMHNGVGMQKVRPFPSQGLRIVDCSSDSEVDVQRVMEQDQAVPFNLEADPGWRVSIYRLNEKYHILSIVMHHIISDGWSIDVLLRELATFHSAIIHGQDPLSQVDALSIQYRDYSVWEKNQNDADSHRQQLEYWSKQLEASRPAEFICDKNRPTNLSGAAGMHELQIDSSVYDRLQRFCKAQNVTPFVVLLTAFRITHYRLTGADDATIGTPNASRDRWELKDMIGFFINMQCIRIKIQHESSFAELVSQVQATVVEAFANQDVPFEKVVSKLQSDRDTSRHPLVQTSFAFHSQLGLREFAFEGIKAKLLSSPITSRFDLEFHLFQQENAFQGQIIYSTDLYEAKTIHNMVSIFHTVLDESLRGPDGPVASLQLFKARDYALLEELDLIRIHRTDYSRHLSVVDVFRQQAAANPARIAVKDSATELSYAQLDQQSERLAHWLGHRSLAAETLIGVFGTRSCDTITAILGILKANLAYVPLDIQTPTGRMQTVLSNIHGNRLILVGHDVQPPVIPLDNVECFGIADALEWEAQTYDAFPNFETSGIAPSATSLAYAMFTSGSTGEPKGVLIDHRAIVKLATQNNLVQHLSQPPIMAHVANIAFDAATWEVYATLLNGGTLICIDAAAVLDPAAHLEILARERVQALLLTPTLLKHYLPFMSTHGDLRTLFVGAEKADTQDLLAARQLTGGKVFNLYGPTENAVISTFFVVEDDGPYTNGVPIGRALSNSGAYVMDPKQRLVPLGVVGELVVTGDGLARGYTDMRRNVDRFISVKIGDQQTKAYRTGDHVRYNPINAQLEFLSRIDGQVKVRGQRFELGEVEHVLRNHDTVKDAVAIVKHAGTQEACVIAFVTLHDKDTELSGRRRNGQISKDVGSLSDTFSSTDAPQNERLGAKDAICRASTYDGSDVANAGLEGLHQMLNAHLTSYMVPQTVAVLERLPVNENGKIDRQALLMIPQTQRKAPASIQQPTSKMEQQIQSIWAFVLNMEPHRIGLDESFFQLGGNSITAMKVVAKASEASIKLAVAQVFRYPKLRDLAKQCVEIVEGPQERIAPFALLGSDIDVTSFLRDVSIHPDLVPTDIHDAYPCTPHQQYLMSSTLERPGDWIAQAIIELSPDVAVNDLYTAWENLYRAMPVFRTRFVRHHGLGLIQVVVDEDLHWASANGLEQYLETDRKQSMRLGQPLTRFALIEDGTGSVRWLVWTMHHALYDGWSMMLIMDALKRAYKGEPIVEGPQFQALIKYTMEQDSERASDFWRRTLAGCWSVQFPTLPPTVDRPVADQVIEHIFSQFQQPSTNITMSTLIHAAWGIIAGHVTNSKDVVFGAAVYGRNAPVTGIQAMAAQTSARVPIRVRLASGQKVSQYLENVQQQAIDMTPFEQTGLRQIADMSDECRKACMFQTLIMIQPQDFSNADEVLGMWKATETHRWFTTYSLKLELQIGAESLKIVAYFDTRAIDSRSVRTLLGNLESVMHQLQYANVETTLAQIDVTGSGTHTGVA